MSQIDPSQSVGYWAISIASSRTAQFAALTFTLGVLSLPEVLALIPLRYMPAVLALVSVVNFILRTRTVRPVAFIAPGNSRRVAVPRLEPRAMRDSRG